MSKTQIRTACVMMVGPDERMDERGNPAKPVNPLPIMCPHCTFPDLDFIARPYLLAKGIASPAETSPADVGNFLVRERVRRILEVVVPDACTFHPTADRKSKKSAPWWLAVPKILETPRQKPNPPYCPKCHDPKVWCYSYADDYWAEMKRYDTMGIDIFKSLAWESRPEITEDFYTGVEPLTHPERWTRRMLSRDLYFSIRLEQLFKRAKVKGQLVRSDYFKDLKPTPEDEEWIDDRLKLLAEHGLVDARKPAACKTSSVTQKWYEQFLKRNAKQGIKNADFAAVEKKHKLILPQDYKEFISTVGPKSFEDVNETEGFTANLLPPEKLDFKDYRRGKVPHLDEEQSQIDGVMFATTDHGDCFVFDVSAKGNDYPVFWYDHEQNSLEPFAPNFTECIKRFVQKN